MIVKVKFEIHFEYCEDEQPTGLNLDSNAFERATSNTPHSGIIITAIFKGDSYDEKKNQKK